MTVNIESQIMKNNLKLRQIEEFDQQTKQAFVKR